MTHTTLTSCLERRYQLGNIVYVYTDGSSDYKEGTYGSGAVLLDSPNEDAKVLSEVSKGGNKKALSKYNNVTGEVLACCYGIEKAVELGYKQVVVYVDYEGLIKWYEGSWQARNILRDRKSTRLNSSH